MGLHVSFPQLNEQGEPVLDQWGYEVDRLDAPNIYVTHNLARMASYGKKPIYQALWRPEQLNFTKASQLAGAIRDYLSEFEKYPSQYREFDPPNGWGSYDSFHQALKKLLEFCEQNPDAKYSVSV